MKSSDYDESRGKRLAMAGILLALSLVAFFYENPPYATLALFFSVGFAVSYKIGK